jgi:hypothetical protein
MIEMLLLGGLALMCLVLAAGLGWMALNNKYCEWFGLMCEPEPAEPVPVRADPTKAPKSPPTAPTDNTVPNSGVLPSTLAKFKAVVDRAVLGGEALASVCVPDAAACAKQCESNTKCKGFDFNRGTDAKCSPKTKRCLLRGSVAIRQNAPGWTSYCWQECPKLELAGYTYNGARRLQNVQQQPTDRVEKPYQCQNICDHRVKNCTGFSVGGLLAKDQKFACYTSTDKTIAASSLIKDNTYATWIKQR